MVQSSVLSQEGAIRVIDARATVLRVNQSKLRQDKGASNDVALSPDHPHPPPPSALAPRERLDLPRERAIDQIPRQGAPEVYWTAPRGVRPDVMELSDGSGAFLAVCNQHGLRTGSSLALGSKLFAVLFLC